MKKSFSIIENRRKVIEEKLELLELDRILFDQGGAPYVLERHEQMMRQIIAVREEIAYLLEQEKLIEANRRQRPAPGAGDSLRKKAGKGKGRH